MLILSRKKGEAISIGKDIIVRVIGIEGDNIKLGIDAPKDMKILRTELYEEIIEENREAANISEDVFRDLI
jgi:carbon storage regulator